MDGDPKGWATLALIVLWACFAYVALLCLLLVCDALLLAGKWRTLEKTGRGGWAALVPFYGNWQLASAAFDDKGRAVALVACEAANWPLSIALSAVLAMDQKSLAPVGILLIVLVAACTVGYCALVLMMLWRLSRLFGHGKGWFLGLWLVPFVFWPMLGLGKSVCARKPAPPLPVAPQT